MFNKQNKGLSPYFNFLIPERIDWQLRNDDHQDGGQERECGQHEAGVEAAKPLDPEAKVLAWHLVVVVVQHVAVAAPLQHKIWHVLVNTINTSGTVDNNLGPDHFAGPKT